MPEKQTMTRDEAKAFIEEAALEAENANYHALCGSLYELKGVLEGVELPMTILTVVDLEYSDNIAYIEVVE